MPPPAPLLTLLQVALLLYTAAPATAAPAPAPAAPDDATAAAADALEALGAAPALLARLHAWDAAPPAPGPATGPAPVPALFLAAPDDLDAQEAAAVEALSREVPRVKRTGAQSLSIVAPLDVLRQRLMNELNRRRMRELQNRTIEQNRVLLTSIGKRTANRLPVDPWSSWGERFAATQA